MFLIVGRQRQFHTPFVLVRLPTLGIVGYRFDGVQWWLLAIVALPIELVRVCLKERANNYPSKRGLYSHSMCWLSEDVLDQDVLIVCFD